MFQATPSSCSDVRTTRQLYSSSEHRPNYYNSQTCHFYWPYGGPEVFPAYILLITFGHNDITLACHSKPGQWSATHSFPGLHVLVGLWSGLLGRHTAQKLLSYWPRGISPGPGSVHSMEMREAGEHDKVIPTGQLWRKVIAQQKKKSRRWLFVSALSWSACEKEKAGRREELMEGKREEGERKKGSVEPQDICFLRWYVRWYISHVFPTLHLIRTMDSIYR